VLISTHTHILRGEGAKGLRTLSEKFAYVWLPLERGEVKKYEPLIHQTIKSLVQKPPGHRIAATTTTFGIRKAA